MKNAIVGAFFGIVKLREVPLTALISYQLASAGTNNNDDYFSILPKLMTLRSTQSL